MSRHSGAMRSIEPGISRFRVWSFGPSRNDEIWIASSLSLLAMTLGTEGANGKRSESGWNFRRSMPVRQGLLRDRHTSPLGLARSFAWQPPRAWRGLRDLCRKLAQAVSHHQGQGGDCAFRGQDRENRAELLRAMRHAAVL